MTFFRERSVPFAPPLGHETQRLPAPDRWVFSLGSFESSVCLSVTKRCMYANLPASDLANFASAPERTLPTFFGAPMRMEREPALMPSLVVSGVTFRAIER